MQLLHNFQMNFGRVMQTNTDWSVSSGCLQWTKFRSRQICVGSPDVEAYGSGLRELLCIMIKPQDGPVSHKQ